MPWKETDPQMERARFLALHQEGLYSMSELCTRFGISRKTGYKWLDRFATDGVAGLAPQSRAPLSCPHRVPPTTEAALVAAREAHPHWGPKKLIAYLARTQPDLLLPAPSTAGAVLQRHDLVRSRPRRRPVTHPGCAPLVATAPNDVWLADFKGEFATRSGTLCHPLTVTDAYSRFLLACDGLASAQFAGTQEAFRRLFAERGLPQAIRTDNGAPFASHGLGGLSRLNVWWLKLGIAHQRIRPGRPQENGRHERMHRTLKAETTRPPAWDLPAQQQCFAAFRTEFNTERPHEALAQSTPASHYAPATRTLPSALREPEYGGHLHLRRVDSSGYLTFRNHQIYVSEVLARETVGLEEVDEGVWTVQFYEVLLGRLQERDWKIQG